VPRLPEAMSPAARDFVLRSLAKHSADRPTVLQMLQHEWLRSFPARGPPAGLVMGQQQRGAGGGPQVGPQGQQQWSHAVEKLWQGFAVLSNMWSWVDAEHCGLLQPQQPQHPPAAQLGMPQSGHH
jgi:serine/threonine protein kinase